MHTGGEPLRVITEGFPDLKGNSVLEYRRYCKENLDHLRTALMFEPRGHADMYGCILTPPNDDEGDFGDIIWQGKIPAGEKIKISSTDGHIRYQYKMKAHEGYEGDISADCYEQLTILVD